MQHASLRIAALGAKVDAAATPLPAAPWTPPSGGGGEASVLVAGPGTGEGEQELFARARSFEQAGHYEEAIDCLDQALAMGCRPSPSPQPSPQRGEGETEGSQHRHEADAWYIRGCCLQQLGELEEAIASLDRSLELGPNQPEAWYHKGVSEQLSNSDTEAARSFEKFLSLASPEDHGALIEDARHRQKKLSAGAAARPS